MRDIRRLFPTTNAGDDHVIPVNVAEVRNLRVHNRGRYGSSATGLTGSMEIDLSLIFWQKSFHDERIRNAQQRSSALAYVQGNAMKHGLVTNITDWPWASLHFPELLDPMDVWLD